MEPKPSRINPWVPVLLIAIVPAIVVIFFLYKWSSRSDFRKITEQVLERQNAVLAMDTMEVVHRVSVLLENAARDLRVLALIAPTERNLVHFYQSKISKITEIDPRDESVESVPIATYSELSFFSSQGDEKIRLVNGKPSSELRKAFQCPGSTLCDPQLFLVARQLAVGQVYYGSLLRWYTPKEGTESSEGAILPVVSRAEHGYFLVGIDYRFFRDFLLHPTFPYERKRDLLQSYQSGNYIYIVDSERNTLAHPKTWHATGIVRTTGKRVETMQMDEDEGLKALNIADYRGKRLKHFERMLTRSFVQKDVDIFQSSDLKGTNRVLSVAPILLSEGQFKNSGVFGHVIVGCNIEYFQQPKARYVPYY